MILLCQKTTDLLYMYIYCTSDGKVSDIFINLAEY